MSKSRANAVETEETALQLIKESLNEEINAAAHVFVVFGASVRRRHCSRNNLIERYI